MNSDLSRRQVLILSALAAAQFTPTGRVLAQTGEVRLIDVGPIADYQVEGIYTAFQQQGFFLVRQGNKIFALTAFCTHRRSRLRATPDGFSCAAHGSQFGLDGKVRRTPARIDLPRHPVSLTSDQRVMVDLSKTVNADDPQAPGASITVG